MTELDPLAVGDVLDGKYRIEAAIGSGGMGTVYRARHIGLDSTRAIKLMRPELAKDDSFVHRFENEAHVAEGVRHPNVVALYDFATLPDGTKYIVWELVEGETVRDCLERGDVFTTAEVIRLVEEIGGGLAAAHEQGILHRDVSPDNIMLCDGGTVEGRTAKLLDFGVAKAAGSPQSLATTTGMVFGKIGYASPEQMGLLKKEEMLDARTDVFSLAAVAYAMLTGEPPFETSSMRSFLHDLMIAPETEHRDRFAKALDEPWRTTLTRALARERDERPSTMNVFVDEIRAPAPERRRLRNLLLISAAALCLLLVSTTTMLMEVSDWPTPPRVVLEPRTVVFVAGADNPFEIPDDASSSPVEEPRGPEPTPTPREEENPLDVGTEEPDDELEGEGASGEPPRPPDGGASPDGPETDDAKAAAEESDTHVPDIEEEEPDELVTEEVEQVSLPPPSPPPRPSPPRIRRRVQPKYPDLAVALEAEGTVVLRITIAPSGDVTSAEILQAADTGNDAVDRELARSAIDAALQWKYERGSDPTELNVPVVFDLSR